MTDFKSSKLKSSKRVDASIARALCPCTACRNTGRNILFLAPFFSLALPPLTLARYLSLSLSLSLYFWRCSATSRFVLFVIWLFPSYPIQQTSVLANSPLAPCSISISELRRVWSHRSRVYSSLHDRYRSHRQHFRRHVFELCIFIPLKQTILLSRLEAIALLPYTPDPLNLFPSPIHALRKPRAAIREHRSRARPALKLFRKYIEPFSARTLRVLDQIGDKNRRGAGGNFIISLRARFSLHAVGGPAVTNISVSGYLEDDYFSIRVTFQVNIFNADAFVSPASALGYVRSFQLSVWKIVLHLKRCNYFEKKCMGNISTFIYAAIQVYLRFSLYTVTYYGTVKGL